MAVRRARIQEPPAGATPSLEGIVPFTSASHEHTELAFDLSQLIGANTVQLAPQDVPAFGYLRHIWLLVEGSGGALGTGVLSADYPFNILQSVALTDVNGAPIMGPLDGYALAQANIWGAYGGLTNDPRQAPFYDATINPVFALRIPVEIAHHNGFGSLANQNAAAAYRVNVTLNNSAGILSTVGTATPPTIRLRAFAECWTLPDAQDVLGRPQAMMPPRHGTTQYFSYFQRTTGAGANTVLLPRVGNLLRMILIIARTAAGARQDNVFADPVNFQWDARMLRSADPQRYIINAMRERQPQVTRDTGVFGYLMNADVAGGLGDDDPTFWLPTVQASRLQLDGSSVTAGSWQIITNDVAPVEVAPEERFVEQNRTGHQAVPGPSAPVVAGQ